MLDGCASWCVTFASSPLWSARKCHVKAADLHHRSLNAAAAKARIGWSFGEAGFPRRYRQVSTLVFEVEVPTACSQIVLMILLLVTLVAPSLALSRPSLVSLQATGDIPGFLLYFALAVEETSPQEQLPRMITKGSFEVCPAPSVWCRPLPKHHKSHLWGKNTIKEKANM